MMYSDQPSEITIETHRGYLIGVTFLDAAPSEEAQLERATGLMNALIKRNPLAFLVTSTRLGDDHQLVVGSASHDAAMRLGVGRNIIATLKPFIEEVGNRFKVPEGTTLEQVNEYTVTKIWPEAIKRFIDHQLPYEEHTSDE